MYILIYGLSLFIFFSINSFATTALPDSSYKQVHKLYQDLQKLPFDPAKIATIEDLTYTKDRAQFLFKKGTFYFAQPVAGKITGAVFSGEGLFELKPPTEIERAHVRRFLDKDSLRKNFSTAYLRFSDETARELISQLDLQRGDISPDVHSIHEKISKVFLEDRGFNLASRILADILNKTDVGLFLAVLQHEQPKLNFPNYYIFQYDPQVREEVSAYQYFPYRVNKPFYTLCSFQQLSEYTRGLTQFEENKDALQINHYKMNLELERNGKITAKVAMTFTPLLDSLQYLPFDLNQELKIDSVKNSVGDSLLFIKEKKETSFSVMLKEAVPSQKQAKIIVYYSGKVLDPIGPNLFLKDKFYWFPRYGYLVPATYDLTFEYPRNWQVISIGEKIKSWQSDKQVFSTWVQEIPSLTAVFALGKFDSTTYDIADSLPIKIYSTYEHSKSMREKIGGDVANSYFIFQNLLGYDPSSHLNVVENPSRTSYSFPGILLLSSLTFSQELEGVMEALRGHEVSHQWWGNWVGWKSYHDQWLSEGLAEYSGAMSAQLILDGD
ncbi:MAG: M1 family aminopeptidase, partial [bacterium]